MSCFDCLHTLSHCFVWWLHTNFLALFQHATSKLLWEILLMSYHNQLDNTQAPQTGRTYSTHTQLTMITLGRQIGCKSLLIIPKYQHTGNKWLSGLLCRHSGQNKPITGTTSMITGLIIMRFICYVNFWEKKKTQTCRYSILQLNYCSNIKSTSLLTSLKIYLCLIPYILKVQTSHIIESIRTFVKL